MAVTKQTYTATATWTVSQLTNLFESAFIDAGLMTAWYDSFLSGSVENRILEIQYNAAKAYGKTYYWFMFTTTGIFVYHASGWNATTHVPTGTIYLDYYSATTNSTTNHFQIFTSNTSIDFSVTRYSSAITTGYAWFVAKNGTAAYTFHIARAATSIPAWIDLDKTYFHMHLVPTCVSSAGTASITFQQHYPITRRSYVGCGLRGTTSITSNESAIGASGCPGTHMFQLQGNENNNFTSQRNSENATGRSGVVLPMGYTNNNPSYVSNSVPVFTGFVPTLYLNETAPADFGFVGSITNNTIALFDTFTVTPAVEVWDVLRVANGTNLTGAVSVMFLARTT